LFIHSCNWIYDSAKKKQSLAYPFVLWCLGRFLTLEDIFHKTS